MKKVRILSLDGGGIRGVISGTVLAALEKEIQKQSKKPEARLSDYFDLIAGTSTGGILAIALLIPDKNGRPKYTAEEAVNLYMERGTDIFKIPFGKAVSSGKGMWDEKYPHQNLEKALKDYFGKTMMSHLLRPALISSYDIKNANPYFFKSHKAKMDKGYEVAAWKAARATSAAPTYFECALVQNGKKVRLPLIDGGVFVNNPALCAYSEARIMTFKQLKSNIRKNDKRMEQHPTAKDMIIVSVGTASSESHYTYNKAKDWGAVEWIKPVINIMMGGVADTVDYQLRQIWQTTRTPEHYYRIDPVIGDADGAMDNAKKKNLIKLKEAGELSAKKYKKKIEAIADSLIHNG